MRGIGRSRTIAALALTALLAFTAACDKEAPTGPGGGDQDDNVELSTAVCNSSAGPFSLTIDNRYFPLAVGDQLLFQGTEDGADLVVQISVLNETEDVAGVTTRVVEERELEDGEIVEVSRNFFAQAPDGTVCYFGEDVDIYEDGEVVSHEGAWRAGEGENQPGILMPASPEVGMIFQQEVAPGVALDRAEIVSIGATFSVPAGTFDDTLATVESSPLDAGAVSRKRYAPGVGLIVDEPVELIGRGPLF